MVICAAVGCEINSIISKELNTSLYRLPREEALKIVWKQKLRREKLPVDENIRVCHLHFGEECFEWDLQVYTIYMPINIYPIILANLTRIVWLNYSEVTLNFVTVHVFNYKRRHWDLCCSIVILHVSSWSLENTCERRSLLLIKS